GQTLSEAGDYVVSGNVSCGPGDTFGISINANNIHLILSGNLGSASTPGIVSSGQVSNILIDGGGVVVGVPSAISLSGSHITIKGISAASYCVPNMCVGMQIQGDHINIIGNSASGSKAAILAGSSGRIINNTILLPPSAGLGTGIGAGDGNIIRGNKIPPNTIGGDAAIRVCSHNVVRDNALGGILISGDSNSVVANSASGIEVGGDRNRIVKNDVTGGYPDYPGSDGNYLTVGIFIESGASSNVVVGNSVSGAAVGLFDANGPPCVNVWRHNMFSSSGGAMACIR
ncbi:MAG TPA: hypothetical protein VJ718_09480, partial [Candidatus Binataceae bacterium]|nr:hypothetical protein [Candidatus Binataceae bacterium]